MATHSSILAWRIPMERGAWWATDHGVARSRTRLNDEAQQHSCLGASNSFLHSFVSSVCVPSFFSSATQESRTLYYPLVVQYFLTMYQFKPEILVSALCFYVSSQKLTVLFYSSSYLSISKESNLVKAVHNEIQITDKLTRGICILQLMLGEKNLT